MDIENIVNRYEIENHVTDLDGAESEQVELWIEAANKETDATERTKALINAAWYAGRAAAINEYGIDEIDAADTPDEVNADET